MRLTSDDAEAVGQAGELVLKVAVGASRHSEGVAGLAGDNAETVGQGQELFLELASRVLEESLLVDWSEFRWARATRLTF